MDTQHNLIEHLVDALVALADAAEQRIAASTPPEGPPPSDYQAAMLRAEAAAEWSTTPGMVALAHLCSHVSPDEQTFRRVLATLVRSGVSEGNPALLALGAEYSNRHQQEADTNV